MQTCSTAFASIRQHFQQLATSVLSISLDNPHRRPVFESNVQVPCLNDGEMAGEVGELGWLCEPLRDRES